MQNPLSQIVLLIPSYNPTAKLTVLVDELKQLGFTTIVIVNDGSHEDCKKFFPSLKNVDLIHSNVNQGKGAALKIGFQHILNHHNDKHYVICCDDDGQHSPIDIFNIVQIALQEKKECIFLGSRAFDKDVPLKSYMGNWAIGLLFHKFFKRKLRDTQTGLRCIPLSALPHLINIPYNRFQFEFASLICFIKKDCLIREVPIQTIYFENNKRTKFKSVKDSWQIVKVLFSHFS